MDHDDRRQYPRREAESCVSAMLGAGGVDMACCMRNISLGGAMVELFLDDAAGLVKEGDIVLLDGPRRELLDVMSNGAARVVWKDDRHLGLRFLKPFISLT